MPVHLNTILETNNINPKDVRLIRHKDTSAKKGRNPYELWTDDRTQFEYYQSIQSPSNRKKFSSQYWAVFIADYEGKNMFAGLYSATYLGLNEKDLPMPHNDRIDSRGTADIYDLQIQDVMQEYIGRLFIDWGAGHLAWVQHAAKRNKIITELREKYKEPVFPGFLKFIQPLSKINSIPSTWKMMLKSVKGVYLLTCPKTKELYIGSATGENGFWQRWEDYIATGHGGNKVLKERGESDYQISILEVAGTSATTRDILCIEGLWQRKLQSNKMGLNDNLAMREKVL